MSAGHYGLPSGTASSGPPPATDRPPPGLVVVAGNLIDPTKDCQPVVEEDGRVTLRCEGGTGDAIGVGTVMAFVVLGILGIFDALGGGKWVQFNELPNLREDPIQFSTQASSQPVLTKFVLDTHHEMWAKSLSVWRGAKPIAFISTQGTRRKQELVLPTAILTLPDIIIVLAKAKALGVMTAMYKLTINDSMFPAQDLYFKWMKD
jgi:hypothetical protein